MPAMQPGEITQRNGKDNLKAHDLQQRVAEKEIYGKHCQCRLDSQRIGSHKWFSRLLLQPPSGSPSQRQKRGKQAESQHPQIPQQGRYPCQSNSMPRVAHGDVAACGGMRAAQAVTEQKAYGIVSALVPPPKGQHGSPVQQIDAITRVINVVLEGVVNLILKVSIRQAQIGICRCKGKQGAEQQTGHSIMRSRNHRPAVEHHKHDRQQYDDRFGLP